MPAIEIRTLTRSDVHGIVRLLGILNPEVPPEVIESRLATLWEENQDYQIAGAFADGALAGICGAGVFTKVWCGKCLEIENLVVDPAFRGAGIGARLIEHFTAIARRRGCQVLTLDSYAENRASHRLYERHGFEPWSIHFVNPIGNWTGADNP